MVDHGAQVIVATGATNQAPDPQHLPAMVAAVEANLGRRPVQALGDAGYYSAANVEFCEVLGIDALLSVAREKHVLDGGTSPWPVGDPRGEMYDRMRSAIGKGAYSRRKCIVEAELAQPVFGQIRDAPGRTNLPAPRIGRGPRRVESGLRDPQPTQTI